MHPSMPQYLPPRFLPSIHPSRGVYPYTLVAQMRHLQNWGKGFWGPWGERTKNIDVLMIVISLNWQTVFQIISKFLGVRIVAYCPIGDSCS